MNWLELARLVEEWKFLVVDQIPNKLSTGGLSKIYSGWGNIRLTIEIMRQVKREYYHLIDCWSQIYCLQGKAWQATNWATNGLVFWTRREPEKLYSSLTYKDTKKFGIVGIMPVNWLSFKDLSRKRRRETRKKFNLNFEGRRKIF